MPNKLQKVMGVESMGTNLFVKLELDALYYIVVIILKKNEFFK